jgi:hypothetical protein
MNASGATGTAGNGASGVVFLRIPTTNYTATYTNVAAITTDGSHTVLEYRTSGTYTA